MIFTKQYPGISEIWVESKTRIVGSFLCIGDYAQNFLSQKIVALKSSKSKIVALKNLKSKI